MSQTNKTYYWMEREWWDDPIFAPSEKEPFCKRAAWAYLIGKAHWDREPKEENINGTPVELNRGELTFSIRYLATAWGWTPSKTQRFIDGLKKCQKIDTRTDTGQLIIRLCNYDKIQDAVKNKIQEPIQERYRSDTNIKTNKTYKTDNSIPDQDLFGESRYAFEGDVIKLDKKDFDAFKKNYFAIDDLDATLFSEDVFLSRDEEGIKRQKKWFLYLTNRLKQIHERCLPQYRKNQEMQTQQEEIGFSSYDPAYAKPRPVN